MSKLHQTINIDEGTDIQVFFVPAAESVFEEDTVRIRTYNRQMKKSLSGPDIPMSKVDELLQAIITLSKEQ